MGGAVLVLLGYAVGTLRTVCRTARTTAQNDPRKAATTWGEGTQGTTATGTGTGPDRLGALRAARVHPRLAGPIESLHCPSGRPLNRPTAAHPAQVSAHAQSGVLSDARRLNAASIRRASLATLGMPLPAPRRGPSPADASAIADGEAIGVGRAPRLLRSASVPGKLLRSASATAGDAARRGPVPVPSASPVAAKSVLPAAPRETPAAAVPTEMPATSGGADVASESGATSSMGLAEGGHDDERISHKVRAGAAAAAAAHSVLPGAVRCPSQCCAAVMLGRYRALHWAVCIILSGTHAE